MQNNLDFKRNFKALLYIVAQDWIGYGVPNPMTNRSLKERIPLDWILPEIFD
jgi:hypothetical protein